MKFIRELVVLLIFTLSVFMVFYEYYHPQNSFPNKEIYSASAADLNDQFGINGALPSFTTKTGSMTTAANKITEAHFGWSRHEFHYVSSMYFGFYDNAKRIQDARGIQTLGVLAYPSSGLSVGAWQNYVRTVVGHYGSGIPAWEIMNEPDNYLSPADYANYLREAYNIIKEINPNAKVITGGLTSRHEAANFIDGIASAGVWDKFDAVGMHIYHSGSPEQVNWGGGSVPNEISRIAGSINRNGGGKTIWITEMGYKSNEVGEENQGKFLARASVMAKSFPEVEKIFFYRLYDNSDQTYGILNSNLSTKKSFAIVRDLVSQLNGKGGAERVFTNYDILDDNEPVPSGWYAGDTTNGSLILGGDWGYAGMAMTMGYQFDMGAESAYTTAEKYMGEAGNPAAIGMWVKGDNSNNVWKFRVEDAEGETFQLDFGSLSSDWQHVQFVFNRDPAMVSWGGNGSLDFPIKFESVVIDRQGGQDSGTAWIDRIGFLPDIDTYSYKFGDFVVYWKEQDSGQYNLCGRELNFQETPQYVGGMSC